MFSRRGTRADRVEASECRATVPPPSRDGRIPPPAAPGLRFRPQICCHTGQVASVQAHAPYHLAEDPDAVLRLGLRQLRQWDAGGLWVGQLAMDLPARVVNSAALAQSLIWEIDRQDIATRRVMFCAPADGGWGGDLSGLALLARQGCGIELCCLDPEGLALLRNLRLRRARLRIPAGALRDCHADPRRGQVVLSLLALAERYDLATIGDGVRSRDEHGFLAQLGCTIVQGDAVAPLLDPDATANFLREHARPQFRDLLQPRPAA